MVMSQEHLGMLWAPAAGARPGTPHSQAPEGRVWKEDPGGACAHPVWRSTGSNPAHRPHWSNTPGLQQSCLKPQRCGTIIARFAHARVPSSQPRGCKDSDPSPIGPPEPSTLEHTALFFPFCSLLFTSLSHTPSPIMPWPCQPPHQRRLCRTTA